MDQLKSSVNWYQTKIGDHDKQSWEQTIEGKILSSIENLPKKDATKERRELLDIDLIKGSTFTKAKPSHSSYVRTWKGLVRIVFLPFFYKWWILHTSLQFLILGLFLYIAQIFVTVVAFYFTDQVTASTSLFEVTNPLLFMFALSVIHTQIVFTKSSKCSLYKNQPPRISPRNQPKRGKKVVTKTVKLVKRKSKTTGTSRLSITECSPGVEELLPNIKKISSDSEDVDDNLLRDTDDYVETTDLLDEMEEDCLSSEDSSAGEQTKDRARVVVEVVPDVAADAENKVAAHSDSERSIAGKANSDRKLRTSRQDSSDVEYRAKIYVTDTDWDGNSTSKTEHFPNWVNNSDVASESTSEYESELEKEEEPSIEGPICLKAKVSHTLAYVPSVHDRISCIVWEEGDCKKVDLSVPDLGALIERQAAQLDYEPTEILYISVIFTLLIASFPFLFRLYYSDQLKSVIFDLIARRQLADMTTLNETFTILCGSNWQEIVIVINGYIQRIFLFGIFSFLVLVAEKSYWQRYQLAKYFLCLTSARKSKKYGIPHFRLNKVKNIKIWLSLRAYLKKRGPQRSVEVIVSSVFILMVFFLALMCVQLLNDVNGFIQVYGNWELTLCCGAMALFLLRFYSLGTKITKKYRCLSTLITEQMNLYLHMEQKPHKKDELLVANSVLKLAEDLIKELESPYRMSTAAVNPVVFNIIRLAMLSAFSAVASELLGFKLKLYKVKL